MGEGVARSVDLPPKIGRHVVLGYLADGGMAEIFLGKEPDGRAVVIKRILPHLARQGSFVSMFIDEARIGSLVHHPNVVEVYELGQVGSDLFMVMEYLDGESVSGLMRRLVSRAEVLPFALGAHIVAEACAGLHAAHELRDDRGTPLHLVHRDISPQNVFVTYDGDVKVLDFGIATAAHRLTRTATGQVKGKFSYMSPEQCRGESLDPRSDIFSLGVLLYELTTQRRLFKRANELMVLKAVTEQPIPRPSREVPGYPAALEAICMRALERDKDRRYVTALQMRLELLSAIEAIGGPADPRGALGEGMHLNFADRIEEKRQMLSHVRLGTDLGRLPEAEVDQSVEVPQVEEYSATPIPGRASQPSLAAEPPPRRRAGPLIAIAAVLVSAAIGVGWYVSRGDGSAREASPPPPNGVAGPAAVPAAPAAAPAPDLAVAPPADAAAGVTVHVETIPPGAQITVDREPRGVSPSDIHVDRAGRHTIALALAGYAPIEQTLALDHDQHLLIPLVTKPVAPPPAKPPVRHPPKRPPPKDPFQRYD